MMRINYQRRMIERVIYCRKKKMLYMRKMINSLSNSLNQKSTPLYQKRKLHLRKTINAYQSMKNNPIVPEGEIVHQFQEDVVQVGIQLEENITSVCCICQMTPSHCFVACGHKCLCELCSNQYVPRTEYPIST